jgi:hypothetical protein
MSIQELLAGTTVTHVRDENAAVEQTPVPELHTGADCLRIACCPACGHNVASPFYDGGEKPLAMIAWPASSHEAKEMPKLPLDYVSCLDCSHVFNAAFTYEAVPYAAKPNMMYNRGATWSDFLKELRNQVLAFLPEQPTVVEIGHGDGHFLGGLAESRPQGRYIGFDPHGAREMPHKSVELRADLFNPLVDIPLLRPDLIVSRHVLEHLMNPLELLQGINIAAAWTGKSVQLLFEVPCVDRALEYGRLNDFYFEHYSQFTTKSFHQMLVRAQFDIQTLGHAYNGEVVYALLNTSTRIDHLLRLQSSLAFRTTARNAPAHVGQQLQKLHMSGRKVAIWGGVGKSSAFLNIYGLDAERFPLVVDSDRGKAGTFVPGTGQEIRHCSVLRDEPADIILIGAQWRAKDIVREIDSMGVAVPQIMLEHEGALVDYFDGHHPYR